ncbi:hypothetical protein [Emticicia oligotrophica]|uniref:hypothetical protein n=1 Tax=Emticicia oligotrophica TaxID=312279 RepID=UPI001178AA84|nr:hypothetical protein [Emticicia oligotrophica]
MYVQVYRFTQYITLLLLCTYNIDAYTQHHDTIPYFLRDKSRLYAKSPKKATLTWYNGTRLGMFIH